jgi:hypothetical protein
VLVGQASGAATLLYRRIGIVPALNFGAAGESRRVPGPQTQTKMSRRLTEGARRKASISAHRRVVVTLITDEVASRITIERPDRYSRLERAEGREVP